MLLPTLAFSQEEAFYIEFENIRLQDALEEIEDTYNVLFSFMDDYVADKRISLTGKTRTLDEILIALGASTSLHYKIVGNRYIIISQSKTEQIVTNALSRVVVRSYIAKGIEKIEDGSYKLSPSRLGLLPGLTEPDVLESIQLLPGVLSPNETASSFFVRGGASDQNRILWDGINIYHKGHLFGMISPLNPNVASDIKFINKGSHSRYGERVSSITDINSNSKVTSNVKAELGINGLNADAIIEVPIISDKLSIQASIRRSYTDVLLTPTFNQFADKVFESTKINQNEDGDNDFSFLDYNLRVNYKPNASNSFFASIINIDNALDYFSFEEDTGRDFNDILTINNTGYGVGWSHVWSNRLKQSTQAFFSDYKLNYNFITTEADTQVSDFEKRNTIFDSGLSTEINYNASENLNIDFGYQYTLKDVAYAFVNTTDLSFILDSEEQIVQTHSAFGHFDYKNARLLDLSFGIRGSYYKELDAIRFEPRILNFKAIKSKLTTSLYSGTSPIFSGF